MTEKEIEAALVSQTKDLPMPDGSKLSVTAFQFTWDDLAFLDANTSFKVARVAEIAWLHSQEVSISFETSFPDTVTYIREQVQKSGLLDLK